MILPLRSFLSLDGPGKITGGFITFSGLVKYGLGLMFSLPFDVCGRSRSRLLTYLTSNRN